MHCSLELVTKQKDNEHENLEDDGEGDEVSLTEL